MADPANHSSERLESWKEIASYLNRDVTTVQRWEKREGLPIHRHVHNKTSTVFAYRPELEAWLEGRGTDLESVQAASTETARQRQKHRVVLFAGVALVLLTGVWALISIQSPRLKPAVPSVSEPMTAVFFFNNLNNDPAVDWLRIGLPEMIVTDLSQSTHIKVLTTDRLYKILSDMDRLDETFTSSETVQEVALKIGADNALLGSFAKAGDSLRINIRLQEVATGDVLVSEVVEGDYEAAVFTMVDSLGRSVRSVLDVTDDAGEVADRQIADVTTHSVEAYQYFSEGIRLHIYGKWKEAITLFEKAIELDPEFATAHALLSVMYANVGQRRKVKEHATIAFKQVDRLTTRWRYFVEGWYYSQNDETIARAIHAYEKVLDMYPDFIPARLHLGIRYRLLERYADAAKQFDLSRQAGDSFVGTHVQLARCYAHLDRYAEGHTVLLDWIAKNPNADYGYRALAAHLTRWGKLDEAAAAIDKLESLAVRESLWPNFHRWDLYIIGGDWQQAREAAGPMLDSEDPTWRWRGSWMLAITSLFRGRSQEALAHLDDAGATKRSARLLLELGEPARALDLLLASQANGKERAYDDLFLTALAQERLGHREEADSTSELLLSKAESLPADRETRRYHHLRGEIALARGDIPSAIEHLERAGSMLSPRGFDIQHVPIWYSLASAYLESGALEEAERWYRKIADSSTEHIYVPVPYVRSFYFLGKIHEVRGEKRESLEHYKNFFCMWKGGDIDTGRLAEVESRLQ